MEIVESDFKLYTIPEAVKVLRLSKPTIYRLTGGRKIPHYKAGGKVLFSEEQLREYLKRVEVE